MPKLQNEITSQDISYILTNPWKFTNDEWRLHDELEKIRSLRFLLEKVELTCKGGYSKIWKTPNNLPLAVLGAYKVGDKKLEGFFVASKHMEEERHSLKITFEMRQLIKEQSYHYKGWTLGLYSESKNIQNQLSWLRLIGFTYKPDGNRGNNRYFEYISRVQ
ncbi:MAG: hypothetical protein HKN90_03990 [Flavobacteriaceae bacterium]|nr:hypothetical protein [Flavobacteriaceae bacterium]